MLTSTGIRKMVVFSCMYLKIYNYFGVNHLVLYLFYIPYYLKKPESCFVLISDFVIPMAVNEHLPETLKA